MAVRLVEGSLVISLGVIGSSTDGLSPKRKEGGNGKGLDMKGRI